MARPPTRTAQPDHDEVASILRLIREYRLSTTEYYQLTGCAAVCTYAEFAAALRYDRATPETAQQLGFSLHTFSDWLGSPARTRRLTAARGRLTTAYAKLDTLQVEMQKAQRELASELSRARSAWTAKHAPLLQEADDVDHERQQLEREIELLDLPARRLERPRAKTGRPRGRDT